LQAFCASGIYFVLREALLRVEELFDVVWPDILPVAGLEEVDLASGLFVRWFATVVDFSLREVPALSFLLFVFVFILVRSLMTRKVLQIARRK